MQRRLLIELIFHLEGNGITAADPHDRPEVGGRYACRRDGCARAKTMATRLQPKRHGFAVAGLYEGWDRQGQRRRRNAAHQAWQATEGQARGGCARQRERLSP